MELRSNKLDKAVELADRALDIYPNHLESLLVLGEALVARGDLAAINALAKAWRLCGALAAEHVTAILERRRRHDLWDTVWEKARTMGREQHSEQKTEETVIKVIPYENVSKSSECTKEDVLRIVAEEVFRDGHISAAEQQLFMKIRSRYPLPADVLARIITEAKKAGATNDENGEKRELDGKTLFRKLTKKVFEDGKLSKTEADIVFNVAKLLGLNKEEYLKICEAAKSVSAS